MILHYKHFKTAYAVILSYIICIHDNDNDNINIPACSGGVQIESLGSMRPGRSRLKRDLRELRRVNLDLRRRLAQLSMSRPQAPDAEAIAAPAVSC